MGPTSANSCPARILFLCGAQAKARLLPALSPGNVEKTRAAPVTAIIAYDLRFYERLPRLFPHNPKMREAFAGAPELVEVTARRNSLQGAYFILAARSVGLDCGPMSGFDNAKVDEEFFATGKCEGCDEEFLSQATPSIELPVQSGLWRFHQTLSTQSTARVRGDLQDPVTGRHFYSALACTSDISPLSCPALPVVALGEKIFGDVGLKRKEGGPVELGRGGRQAVVFLVHVDFLRAQCGTPSKYQNQDRQNHEGVRPLQGYEDKRVDGCVIPRCAQISRDDW